MLEMNILYFSSYGIYMSAFYIEGKVCNTTKCVIQVNKVGNTKVDIVVVVRKSGFAWALDRNNGNLKWTIVSWLDILNL